MAIVRIQNESEPLRDDQKVASYLGQHGVDFERWPVPDAVQSALDKPAPDDDEKAAIISGFRHAHGSAAEAKGYVDCDLVVLHPDTPGLDGALAKFDKDHFHDDDEVRYIVDGEGVFGFVPEDGSPFEVVVEAGEYISIPAKAWHWFKLTESRRIKAVRLFQNTDGWVPHYRDGAGAGAENG